MARTAAVITLTAQFALLAVLSFTTGLDAPGWAAGTAYALGLAALLGWGMSRSGHTTLGPPDWVTLTRAVFVGGVTALVAAVFPDPLPLPAPAIALAGTALLLDAVDGRVARGTRTASGFGARFDMEVDAFLLLVLSVAAAGTLGSWVLLIGGMRYAFVAAGVPLPWLRRPVPPRNWRRVVAAIQGVALFTAVTAVLPTPLATVIVLVALALLIESFGRDVRWLSGRRTVG